MLKKLCNYTILNHKSKLYSSLKKKFQLFNCMSENIYVNTDISAISQYRLVNPFFGQSLFLMTASHILKSDFLDRALAVGHDLSYVNKTCPHMGKNELIICFFCEAWVVCFIQTETISVF